MNISTSKQRSFSNSLRAFTLLELLVVIAIVGLLAALTAPALNSFRPNYSASATTQLMDALSHGRQLAISKRTTVYMVFVPTNVLGDTALAALQGTPEMNKVTNLFDKQAIGYNYVSLKSVGDQPGRPNVQYLDAWRTLPDGAFIYPGKFALNSQSFVISTGEGMLNVAGFSRSSAGPASPAIPFPSEDAGLHTLVHPYVQMPYIGWDYMGRLVSGKDEIIPLAKGTVTFSRDATTKKALGNPPTFNEQPAGNATNSVSYNVVLVDSTTGRARAIHQEVR